MVDGPFSKDILFPGGEKASFTGAKGVPLEGPFLGHFSQGNFGKVNENVHLKGFSHLLHLKPHSTSP